MKTILLHNGRTGALEGETLVNDEDYGWLMHWKWRRFKRRGNRRGAGTDYAYRREGDHVTQVYVFMHRAILGLTNSLAQGDHIDGNGLNNQRANLRPATGAENAQNSCAHAGSSSRYRGVSWCAHSRRWQARVGHDGKTFYLGLYSTEQEAAEVALAKRLEIFPFAVLSLTR